MERFGLLVAVCLLPANVVAAVPTVTVERTFDGCCLSGLPRENWPARSASSCGGGSCALLCEAFYAEVRPSAETRLGADDASRNGFRWDALLPCGDQDTGSWPVPAILMYAGYGHGMSENPWQKFYTSAWRLAGEYESEVSESGSPSVRVQAEGKEAAELSLGEHMFSEVLSMGRLSVENEKVRVLDSALARGEKGILPGDREDKLGLAAPAPGAVVFGSLGLGLLGWLRKRAVW